MIEEGSMMLQGGELGDAAIVGAIDEEKVTVLIILGRGACTLDVVINILRRIVPFYLEFAVMTQSLPLGFSSICPDPICMNPFTLLRA